ncbi:DUF3843 family protein [Weeksellaceae bacterium TAE3-ERU29]|nr:DUF3843 family protein [Weeksellaceae bacterium TAE3-ERU29]
MSKIYIKDWMATKPYKKQTNTDLFYLEVSNKVLDAINSNDSHTEFLLTFMDKESIKDFSNFVTSYFEDKISNLNLFNAFVTLNHDIYSKELPFYKTSDYIKEEINLADIQFLIWYFLNLQKQDTFINPFSDEIKELATTIFSVLDSEYEYAPENDQLKKYFSLEKPDKLDEVRYFIDKILTKTYLFGYDTGLELYMRTAELKNGNNKNFQVYKGARDNFIINYPTKLLALRGNKWAVAILGNDKKKYKDIENLGLNTQTAFIYKGETEDSLKMEQISSGKVIEISKENFVDYKRLKEDMILYAGANQWKDKYIFTGIINVINHNDEAIEEAKKDLIAKRILRTEKEKQEDLKSIKAQEKVFLELNDNQEYLITSPKGAVEFINKFYETLEEKEISKDLESIVHLAKSIEKNQTIYNSVIFINPNYGIEFYANIASELDVENNEYKADEVNPAFLMKLMMDDTFSKEFFDFYYNLIKDKKSKQVEFMSTLSKKDIDFILRFFKPTRYESKL